MLDKRDDSDESSQEGSSTIQSDTEGIMFYRQTGPVPLQKRLPQLLTEMLDFINSMVLLHMYEDGLVLQAHVGMLGRHTTACVEKCGWLDQDFKIKNLQFFETSQ